MGRPVLRATMTLATVLVASGCGEPFSEPDDACRALHFGGQSFVEVPDAPALDSFGPMTVEALVFLESLPTEVQVLSHHHHGLHQGYVLLVFAMGGVQFRFQAAGMNYTVGGAALEIGRWYHLAAVFDGAQIRLYVDGEQRGSTDIPVPAADDYDGPLRIGATADAEAFFVQGLIDEVRLSRVARYSRDFVVQDTPFASDADTVALWHFDASEGQQVVDETGQHPGVLGHTGYEQADDPQRVETDCLSDIAPRLTGAQ